MVHAPHHTAFVELKQDEASSILVSLISSRALQALAISLAGWLACCALLAPEPWRRGLLLANAVAIFGKHLYYSCRITRSRRPALSHFRHRLMDVLQLAALVATGGLGSPLLFALLFPYVVISSFVHNWTRNRITAWVLCGLLCVLALVQGTGLHRDPLLLIKAGATSVAIVVGFHLGRRVSAVHDRVVQQLMASRDETRRSYEERIQEQTVLTGEIAHELKNPLASIKGLTDLCQVEGSPQRTPERLKMVRGEILRMQDILEGFLNFSRPLLPLAQQQVDLCALSAEMMELHEGIARGRGVSLTLECEDRVLARCDPRKIKQVVINLLHNAIEASPPGELVRVEVARAGDSARIAVLDRGPGLPRAVLDNQPGFSTKESGSGLGLKIVRSLVYQHRGRLVLGDRAGGGCAAEITLPLEGMPESQGGEEP